MLHPTLYSNKELCRLQAAIAYELEQRIRYALQPFEYDFVRQAIAIKITREELVLCQGVSTEVCMYRKGSGTITVSDNVYELTNEQIFECFPYTIACTVENVWQQYQRVFNPI
jgi:hypothetical protein